MADVNHVLWVEPGKAEVIEKPFPKVGEGFVIVKVHIAPVCTEYKTYATGFLEAYERNDRLGHEGVGEIHTVGPGVSGLREGDRVIVYQGWACGECWVCRHGLGATHCVERSVMRRGAIESANLERVRRGRLLWLPTRPREHGAAHPGRSPLRVRLCGKLPVSARQTA